MATIQGLKTALMQELSNRKKHDKSSLVYCLNHLFPTFHYIENAYKREELIARLEIALNAKKHIDRLLQFETFKHLRPVVCKIGDKISCTDSYGYPIINMCGVVEDVYGDGTFNNGLAIKSFEDGLVRSNTYYLNTVCEIKILK